MEFLLTVEKNLKAILLNKLEKPEEIPHFLTKKMIPFMNCVMGKLYENLNNTKDIEWFLTKDLNLLQWDIIDYIEDCLDVLEALSLTMSCYP